MIKEDLIVVISTKNRYDILPLTLMSIIQNNVRPKEIVIWDDNDEPKDLREIPIYAQMFNTMTIVGITACNIYFGAKRGLTSNHLNTLHMYKDRTDIRYILRIDDDMILENNVIDKLYESITWDENTGAVGCGVYMPGYLIGQPSFGAKEVDKSKVHNKLAEIYNVENVQWIYDKDDYSNNLIEVEHLNGSCFIYNKEAGLKILQRYGNFLFNLSPLCFREDTIFTNGLTRSGYKIYYAPGCYGWHMCLGGSEKNADNVVHDREIFDHYLGDKQDSGAEIMVVNNGIGDHLVFKDVFKKMLQDITWDKPLTLATCFPEIFEDWEKEGLIKQISIAEAKQILSKPEIDKWSVYKYMLDNNWKGHISDAYREVLSKIFTR